MNQSISREIEEKVFRYVPVTPMDKRIIENFIQSKISEAIKEERKRILDEITNKKEKGYESQTIIDGLEEELTVISIIG